MKTPEIIPNWQRGFISYSFWFAVLGASTFLVPVVLWELFELDLDPNIFGWAGFGFTLVALIGRFVAQPQGVVSNMIRILIISFLVLAVALSVARADPPKQQRSPATHTEAAIMAVAVPLLRKWEGVKLVAYQDVIGVWTICSGTTRGVTAGMVKTPAQCDELLKAEALEYWRGVSAYMTPVAIKALTVERGASWTSFAINVGIYAAGKSTATRRLNQGNIPGACEALTWWNKAGGKIYRGLTNRRSDEYQLCMLKVPT